MSNTSLALPQNSILQRIGSPDEREYLIKVMAETIGIPSRDALRTDVIALLGVAAQQTMLYGWVPGIHIHIQKFETEHSKKAREKDASAQAVYTYTLVIGEKAYKDSGARWRERGVRWRYQRKPMTPAEVKEEARLQGFNEALATNAYGMWSRILIDGQDDPANDDDPLWSAGVYTGKIKAGNFWRNDVIPSGVSSRDIAIRRADKRAMMQSMLTLIPIDDLSADARVRQLVDNLRHEAVNRDQASSPIQRAEIVEIEEDGDVLWAKPNARPEPPGARPGRSVDADGVITDDEEAQAGEPEDVDFYPAPSPDPDARPEPPGARPVNNADGPCPVCHAPVGKPHATSCTAMAPEPGNPGARPAKSGARPASPKVEQPPLDFEGTLYRELATMPLEAIAAVDKDAGEVVRKARNADKDSAMKMSASYLKALTVIMQEALGAENEGEGLELLTLLLGYRVDGSIRPGQLVHGFLIKPLRDRDPKWLRPLKALLELCRNIAVATIEGSGPNG